MSIRHWPATERPREKLLDRGAMALSDAELLAIFLRTGIAGTDVHSEAEQLRERADKALYAAKHGGRNRVAIAKTDAAQPD